VSVESGWFGLVVSVEKGVEPIEITTKKLGPFYSLDPLLLNILYTLINLFFRLLQNKSMFTE
jgi:hypothetical protein